MRISDWSSDVCSSDLYRPPALFGREELVAVEQHQLVRLGADERHAATAKAFRAINLAVAGDHAVGEAHGIAKLRERGAEQRDAVVARNIVERAFGSARQPVLRVGAEAGLGPLDLGGGVPGGCPRLEVGKTEVG